MRCRDRVRATFLPQSSRASNHPSTGPSTIANVSGPAVSERDPPICEFFRKAESDLMTASARVRRLDCRGEGLLVRVKLARCSTKANGRLTLSGPRARHHVGAGDFSQM